ncbi:sensor histidine kinase [Pontiella sulfatireligans]|uniref:histidine kinase n=1 Tax=Pontiella sulfatireligans TaxID=2750658 RepID=A0A6C2UT55_9BACT|nr:hybrid sensor histidine kinase/response regulator [Pontiella sulfatireligans]VGO22397.1 Sporulation kinase E [Pontiella sulfatireligans]
MEAEQLQGKVLVIDDERGPRESLRMVLKYDYEIFLADRVDAGIELLRSEQPDLVIMDIRMPEKSGIEGLQEIRDIDPSVSIVMLTGYGDLETAQAAIRFGANDYLQKPFDTDDIQAVVKKYVERSQLKHRKHQAQEELQKMTQSLGREVGKTNKLTSLGAASSELVRDLRNPLTIIRGYLDLLNYELKEKQESTSDEMNEYLDQIESNVGRCAELVESWRALGRFDFSQLQRLNIPKLSNDCFRDAATHTDISFSVQLEGIEEQYEMLGERLQIKRALQNLIDNAVEAVEHQPNPQITVLLSMDGGDLEIKVKDNGCGVDTKRLRWIFEPFDNTATIEKGAGLGLFITKKVIEEHRGSLQFESRISEGTMVTVRLPQAQTALGYFSSPESLIPA